MTNKWCRKSAVIHSYVCLYMWICEETLWNMKTLWGIRNWIIFYLNTHISDYPAVYSWKYFQVELRIDCSKILMKASMKLYLHTHIKAFPGHFRWRRIWIRFLIFPHQGSYSFRLSFGCFWVNKPPYINRTLDYIFNIIELQLLQNTSIFSFLASTLSTLNLIIIHQYMFRPTSCRIIGKY